MYIFDGQFGATAALPTTSLKVPASTCDPRKAGTSDITGQTYDKSGCPISQAEAERVYQTPAKAPATGSSAGEVLTGVGSILAALAPAATGILQTQAEARTAKMAMRRDRQQLTPMYTGPMQPQIIQQGPSTGLILGVVGGFSAIALILILMLKK